MKTIENYKSFLLNEGNKNLYHFRKKIIEKLNLLPFPNKKQEFWRKIELSDIKEISLQPKNFLLHLKKLEGDQTVPLANEEIQIRSLDAIKNDFEPSSLELIYESFQDNYFALLNLLFFQAQIIQIPKNYKIKLILEYECLKEENILHSPLLFFEVGRFSEVQLVEKIDSNLSKKFINQFTYITCNEDSKVFYSTVNKFSQEDTHINQYFIEQKKHSSFYGYTVNFGGKKGKTSFFVNNNGEGSFTKMLGLSYLCNKEHNDVDMTIQHGKSHTESFILYRTLVQDQSHHIFTGNLKIPASLKHINSMELNHNLLLSPKGKAESVPKLEILSQDVVCEHGATVSEIDQEMLFYLYSRGLGRTEARRMLIEGFVAKIIDEMPDSYFYSYIWDEIEKRIKI